MACGPGCFWLDVISLRGSMAFVFHDVQLDTSDSCPRLSPAPTQLNCHASPSLCLCCACALYRLHAYELLASWSRVVDIEPSGRNASVSELKSSGITRVQLERPTYLSTNNAAHLGSSIKLSKNKLLYLLRIKFPCFCTTVFVLLKLALSDHFAYQCEYLVLWLLYHD
jgi:hypothetical protein